MAAKEYWDNEFNKWKEWIQKGSKPEEFLLKDWIIPSDKLIKSKWQWGNCKHSSEIMPEPYWGNPTDPSFIFVNINPATVDTFNSQQSNFNRFDLNYYDIAASNKLNLTNTQNWHNERFQWAKNIDELSFKETGLSIELIPWHSKSASNVTKYIFENKTSVLYNIKNFSKQLTKTGIFKNTFYSQICSIYGFIKTKRMGNLFSNKRNET